MNTNIEQQWQFFLEKVKLSETKMHPTQTRHMKQAFYAAWGQLLLLKAEDEQNMIEQVSKFWKSQL